MNLGISILNDSGQVLVSSDVIGLHFSGKAVYLGLAQTPSGYPYPIELPEPGSKFQGAVGTGHKIYTYRAPYAGAEQPLVFVKPPEYTQFFAVLTHRYVGGYWYFDVIHGGTIDLHPDLYVFVSPNSAAASAETHGVQAALNDGTITFDSRKRPLAIIGGSSIKPPTVPMDGGAPSTDVYYNTMDWHDCTVDNYLAEVDWDFNCANTYTRHQLPVGVTATNLMFAAPSLAQAAYQIRRHHAHCEGCCCWWISNKYFTAHMEYGVFYRNGFRITSSGHFDAGWIPLHYRVYVSAERSSWAPWAGNDCADSMVTPFPFIANTVNNITANMYLLADSTRYA